MKKIHKNKIALISGASGDIGIAITKEFIKSGAKVILLIKKGNLKFFKFCKRNSSKIIKVLKIDLEKEKNLNNIIKKKIINKNIKINTLVNSAAVASGSIFEMTPLHHIKKIFEINFFSQLVLIQSVIKLMKNSSNASICNIGSLSGFIPERGNLPYGTSKSALMFATKILSKELKVYNIRVNAIAPGVVNSRMANDMNRIAKEKLMKKFLQKKEIQPSELAKLISFISSEKAKHINGKIIKINKSYKNEKQY